MSGDRAPYALAGAAGREAMQRAAVGVQMGRLTTADYAVAMAVVGLTALYSRTSDRIRVAELVAATGLHPETVRKSVVKIALAGVVEREHLQGSRKPTLYRLPHPAEGLPDAHPATRLGEDLSPSLSPSPGAAPSEKYYREERNPVAELALGDDADDDLEVLLVNLEAADMVSVYEPLRGQLAEAWEHNRQLIKASADDVLEKQRAGLIDSAISVMADVVAKLDTSGNGTVWSAEGTRL